jgi:hypothetical protein
LKKGQSGNPRGPRPKNLPALLVGVTVDVQPPQVRPAVHGRPPDSGVDPLALPGDIARQTQIERKQESKRAIASFYTGTTMVRETAYPQSQNSGLRIQQSD